MMEYGLHDIIEMKKPHPCKKSIQQSELDAAYGNLWKQGAGAQYTLRQLARIS